MRRDDYCPCCGVNGFLYMVSSNLWKEVVPKEHLKKCVCIECFKSMLKRKLKADDFIGVPINIINADEIEESINDKFGEKFINELNKFVKDNYNYKEFKNIMKSMHTGLLKRGWLSRSVTC